MPIATDPLSLVFIACFLFGLLFLIATALLGSVGHGTHVGNHGAATHHLHVGGHGTGATHSMHAGSHAGSAGTGHTANSGRAPGATSANATQGTVANANQQGTAQSLLSYINLTSIVLFLLGFGFFGYVFHNTVGLVAQFALALALVGGIVVAALLLLMLNRIFDTSGDGTVQDVADRTGLLGKVSLTIPDKGIGEIIYVSPGGMRKSVAARSVDGHRLERDQEIVVVNYQNGIAEVDTWERFLSEEDVGQLKAPASSASPSSTSDELDRLRTLLEDRSGANTELVIRKDQQKE